MALAPATQKTVTHLNKIIRNELTAINQYFLHARILRHQGVAKLAEYEYKESIDEMKHADKLIARVLFLGGVPNLQDLDKLLIGEHAEEMLRCDLKLEHKAVKDLRAAITYVESIEDYATGDLLHEILVSEEEHIDYIETQLRLIGQIGVENYIQTQV